MRLSTQIIFLALFFSFAFQILARDRELEKDLKELNSSNGSTARKAAKRLTAREVELVWAMNERIDKLSTRQKERLGLVLSRMEIQEADELMVDLAMSGVKDSTFVRLMLLIKKRNSSFCRRRLIQKAKDQKRELRNKAIEAMVLIRDFALIEELIDELAQEYTEARVVSTNVSLDMNPARTEHSGTTRYPMTYRTARGDNFQNNISMPIISKVSVDTQVTISARQVLRRITGKNFGKDTKKWRDWLDKIKKQAADADKAYKKMMKKASKKK